MAEISMFSTGMQNLLEQVRPHGRPDTSFPLGLNVTDTRRSGDETIQEWFVRLVDKHCSGDPTRVAIEDNVAVFAKLKWQKDQLVYASIPTLVTECDLETFYFEGDPHAIYLRLDLDYTTLGNPFSHSLPHLESWEMEDMRFALEGGTSGNVVADYFEFIYRNRLPDKWLIWARQQWLLRKNAAENDDENDPFNRIVQAFRDNQFGTLKAYAQQISQIKNTLREAKDSLFGAHMNGLDREILEYPLARSENE